MHRRRAHSLRVHGARFAAGALALASPSRAQPQPPAAAASPQAAELARASPAAAPPRMADPARPEPAAPDPLAGLGSTPALAALGPLRGPPGSWVEYAVRSKGRPPGRVRVSLLQEPAPQGRRWLEIASASAAGLAVATKVLLRDDAAGSGAIERLIVFVAGQPPFELPVDPARAPQPRAGRGDVRVKPLGEERVTVPAGSFRASRVRLVDATSAQLVWRAQAVPLWGIVRTRGPGGGAELRAYALTGARSVFPGGASGGSAPAPAQGNGSESAK